MTGAGGDLVKAGVTTGGVSMTKTPPAKKTPSGKPSARRKAPRTASAKTKTEPASEPTKTPVAEPNPEPNTEPNTEPNPEPEQRPEGESGGWTMPSGSGTVNSGAGFILGMLLWGWVVLPFLNGGVEGVRNMLRAKFLNKGPDGKELK